MTINQLSRLRTLVTLSFGLLLLISLDSAALAQAPAACELPDASGPAPAVALEPFVDGLEAPVFLTHAGDGSGRLFAVEQPGTIRIIEDGEVRSEPFLDLRERVSFGGERGLLSVAFHPDYADNGRFFVNYTAAGDGRTVVAEYGVSSDPDVASPQERALLEIDQPFSNHNGGQLQFGPDGFLYIGMGDGGSGGDPRQNGQDPGTLLGALLRIDVDAGDPYAVPADNPFVDRADARDELYAYGLRNPWRFSFDRCDGRLFLADVGQNQWEEVNLVEAGGNYGWNVMEGTHCFGRADCDRSGLALPIAEYGHDAQGGRSVTGGYVYRGTDFPGLVGRYLFADFVSGRLWALTESGSDWTMEQVAQADFLVSAFGQDARGELYVLDHGGAVYRLAAEGGAASTLELARALDGNGNNRLDDAEMLAAIDLWATNGRVPGVGASITDDQIVSLVGKWARSEPLAQEDERELDPTLAHVTGLELSGEPGDYTFTVTVQSPDTGCEQYADWWEVLGEDGELLYRRVLLHSHVDEQPFTRSGGPVELAADQTAIVRAHMNTTGYGGQAFRGSALEGFEAIELPADFAGEVEAQQPQPDGCAF